MGPILPKAVADGTCSEPPLKLLGVMLLVIYCGFSLGQDMGMILT